MVIETVILYRGAGSVGGRIQSLTLTLTVGSVGYNPTVLFDRIEFAGTVIV